MDMCTVFGASCRFECVQYSFLPFTASPTSTSSPYRACCNYTNGNLTTEPWGGGDCEITTICIRLRAIRSFHRRDCQVCALGCEVLQSNENLTFRHNQLPPSSWYQKLSGVGKSLRSRRIISTSPKFFMAVTMKVIVVWDVTPWSLVQIYRCYTETCLTPSLTPIMGAAEK